MTGADSTAARLVWICLDGPQVDDDAAALLERGVSGVVLFSRNITGVDQLRGLTSELRGRARGPLRIAIDHEGGHVARMGAPLARFPSAMAIAAGGSAELAYAVARAAGEELAALGIDVNLAPVLDVALDPLNASVGVRSFSSSPDVVGRFGSATVRGYQAAGIAATAKHFPGHGRTPIDSHLALPTVVGGLEALRTGDLPPFRAAIEAGVDLVMASHVAYEGVTDGLPSTLAAPVMTTLLRDELGFTGLTITDALDMRAVADDHPVPAACVRAVAAGADVVMPLARQGESVAALADAIAGGELSAARVDDALRRQTELDRRLAQRAGAAGETRTPLPNAEHLELAREVARRSLTLVRGADLLPLPPFAPLAVIEFASRRPSPVEEAVAGAPSLASSLAPYLPRLREVIVDSGSDAPAAGRAAVAAAAEADLVVLATRDAYLWPEERALISEIAAAGRPAMLIALRNPYDLAALPWTAGAAAAYADVPATLDALADALTGRAGWPGVLPMDIGSEVAA
jgi:beta-N-acetylhexosaminidase